MAVKNEFAFKGALGGLIAADQEVRDSVGQTLDNYTKKFQVLDMARKYANNLEFSRKERQANLKGKQEANEAQEMKNDLDAKYRGREREVAIESVELSTEAAEHKLKLDKKYGASQIETDMRYKGALSAQALSTAKTARERLDLAWAEVAQNDRKIDLDAKRASVDAIQTYGTLLNHRRQLDVAAQNADTNQGRLEIEREMAEVDNLLKTAQAQHYEAKAHYWKNGTRGSFAGSTMPSTKHYKAALFAIEADPELSEASWDTEQDQQSATAAVASVLTRLEKQSKNRRQEMDPEAMKALAVEEVKNKYLKKKEGILGTGIGEEWRFVQQTFPEDHSNLLREKLDSATTPEERAKYLNFFKEAYGGIPLWAEQYDAGQ